MVTWEANRVGWALQGLEVPVVLLKGAAYMLSGFDFERGRLFADLDVMVPVDDLSRVEHASSNGVGVLRLNPYDERYYRLWSHELPPMRHFEREVELDVHHTILPLTSRLTPDREKLWERAQIAARYPFSGARTGGYGPAQRRPSLSRRGSRRCCSRHLGSRWFDAPLLPAGRILGYAHFACESWGWGAHSSMRCITATGSWKPLCRMTSKSAHGGMPQRLPLGLRWMQLYPGHSFPNTRTKQLPRPRLPAGCSTPRPIGCGCHLRSSCHTWCARACAEQLAAPKIIENGDRSMAEIQSQIHKDQAWAGSCCLENCPTHAIRTA